ncbi:MAG: AtpZ/AtpI family protein [Planctomycetota bacterium]|jgi:ATP synthase protein I
MSGVDSGSGGQVPAGPIGRREQRRIRARSRQGRDSVWFGLGMFGLIGWSVAVPMLVGVAVGLAIDTRHPGGRPWTLALLVLGLSLGCVNAWYWVSRQHREIEGPPSPEPPADPEARR